VSAVVFFHRFYESVELGNASFDHQPPSKLVAPFVVSILPEEDRDVTERIVRRGGTTVK